MAKYSTGEASGARASMHRFAIFCMAGVRTIILDDRDGLVRLLELSCRDLTCRETGGHFLPVLRLISEIQTENGAWEGRKYA